MFQFKWKVCLLRREVGVCGSPAVWGSERPSSATLGSTPPPRVGGVGTELGAPRARQAPPPARSRHRAVMPHAALSSLVLLLSLATAIFAGKPPLQRPARAQSPRSRMPCPQTIPHPCLWLGGFREPDLGQRPKPRIPLPAYLHPQLRTPKKVS